MAYVAVVATEVLDAQLHTNPISINFERFGSMNAKSPPHLSARRAIIIVLVPGE
ncbi:hypothetical protein NKH45_10415 [Mesorhizobium sp. M1156]|uniref:hypothetical protein n=1 Tax=Mesorhizobium sp. M1156 TaxID=2957064 RepID=UPI00333D6E5C